MSTWIGNNATVKRSKIEIPDPDVPTKFDGPNEVISGDNQYIQFNGSSLKKDVSRIFFHIKTITSDVFWLRK
jgi:hypothetical protein